MSAVVAHAGEETLYVLVPVLLIMFFVHLGKRRKADDEHDDVQDQSQRHPGRRGTEN